MANQKKSDVQIDIEHVDLDASYKPHQSALTVRDKEEEFAYRWVRSTPERMETMLRQGYHVVPAGGRENTARGAGPDGRMMAGGKHVLMRRSKEINDLHENKLRGRARQAEIGPRESFKTKANRVNVDTVDTTKAVLGPPNASVPDNDD